MSNELINVFYNAPRTFTEIESFCQLHQKQLNEVLRIIRDNDFDRVYTSEKVDRNFEHIIKQTNDLNSYMPIITTGDGNCLFNSISVIAFGHENEANLLRLVVVFILLNYDLYFKDLLIKTAATSTFEEFVVETSKIFNWTNDNVLVAVSIMICRPIYCYTMNKNRNTTFSYEYIVNKQ